MSMEALILLRVRMEAHWEKTGLGPDPTAHIPGRRSLLQVEEEGRGQAQAYPEPPVGVDLDPWDAPEVLPCVSFCPDFPSSNLPTPTSWPRPILPPP